MMPHYLVKVDTPKMLYYSGLLKQQLLWAIKVVIRDSFIFQQNSERSSTPGSRDSRTDKPHAKPDLTRSVATKGLRPPQPSRLLTLGCFAARRAQKEDWQPVKLPEANFAWLWSRCCQRCDWPLVQPSEILYVLEADAVNTCCEINITFALFCRTF